MQYFFDFIYSTCTHIRNRDCTHAINATENKFHLRLKKENPPTRTGPKIRQKYKVKPWKSWEIGQFMWLKYAKNSKMKNFIYTRY